jgi:hypothetical protein
MMRAVDVAMGYDIRRFGKVVSEGLGGTFIPESKKNRMRPRHETSGNGSLAFIPDVAEEERRITAKARRFVELDELNSYEMDEERLARLEPKRRNLDQVLQKYPGVLMTIYREACDTHDVYTVRALPSALRKVRRVRGHSFDDFLNPRDSARLQQVAKSCRHARRILDALLQSN